MSRCLTWASSCLMMLWCWHGEMCITHRSLCVTGAHTLSWPLWPSPAWLSERSHTHAVRLVPYEEYIFSIATILVFFSCLHITSVSVDVCHAFVLKGPCRSWVCATERAEERDHFLSVLRSAINSALTEHQWWHGDNQRGKRRFGHHCVHHYFLRLQSGSGNVMRHSFQCSGIIWSSTPTTV